uniref:TASOR pseudo-PARP domain-containing protein n=1 Tax=Knipowitschia caucasica TaxID=637954 RepID=A0AAV2MLR3_KNICA
MGDGLAPKEAAAARPRRESYAGAPNQDEVLFVRTLRENLQGAPERVARGNARVSGRRVSAPPQVVHQRHMPVGTQKFHIPRKTKEKLVKRRNQEGAPGSAPPKGEDEVVFVRAYQENLHKRLVRARAAVRTGWSPQVLHQRHVAKGIQMLRIPRKSKEMLALFQPLSCESREYEDILTVLTSGYLDSASAGSFSYSKPRLVHSETLEKEFVEKRKELKADGRTEKELEESYCFLLADSSKLQTLCEKGLSVGHSRITLLGNPQKGVYLSRCSDLLQVASFSPGATGEILIFKVIKGKVKSMYENVKNLLDPTPRFDSHLSKSISKVTSVLSYRAFELTQHYFYEYCFDELRQRPRQVCPYAVVSFQFKARDTALVSKPMAPLRYRTPSHRHSLYLYSET